jgi:uncharacterized membrane protein
MTTISDNSDYPSRTPRDKSKTVVRARWWLRYVKAKLAWNRLYRAMSYLRSALWLVPIISIVLVAAVMPALRLLDGALPDWNVLGLAQEGEQAMSQTVITLSLSFLVFTFGSLLVAIQIAGGQLTPRIIATTLLRDNVVRYSVGLFVFTLVFAVSALNRLGTASGFQLVTFVISLLGVACMATFLFLIDYAARLLRPVSVVARVANEGLAVIESVYPLQKPAIIIIAIAAAFAANALAQTTVVTRTEPGKAGVEQTIDVTAMIMGIDRTTRDITLRGPKGNWIVVTAGPEVKNFDQMNVGDQVHARYIEALVLELKKGNDLAVTRTDEASAKGAMPGAQPHGVAGRRITVVADVVAVNRATQTVTLRGPQLTVDVKVTDPDQLRRIKKGDQVYATYTQALAMVVEAAPKK